MLDAESFFDELIEILNKVEKNSISHRKLKNNLVKEIYTLFLELIYFLLQNQKQYFPTNFSRISFLINNFKISDEIKKKILFVHSNLSWKKKESISKNKLLIVISFIADIISYFLKTEKLKIFSQLEEKINTISENTKFDYFSNGELISLYKIIAKKINKENSTIEFFYEDIEIEIDFSNYWEEIPKCISQGNTLNCLFLSKKDRNKFETVEESLIVVEPDYLYDITDISQCFSKNGSNAYLYFINKFFPKQTTYYTFLGNLINQIFDYLLIEENPTFQEIFKKAISKKILPYLVLKQKVEDLDKNIRKEAEEQYQTLLYALEIIKKFQFQIEPTFFSAEFGIIGRMDLLLESPQDKNWKTIIELKSGNFPTNNVLLRFGKGNKTTIGMWYSHYAQTIGYNLLLGSSLPNRFGSSMILYSRDKEKPLREANCTNELKREFLKTRNWIYLLEMNLAKGNYGIFDTLEKYLTKQKNAFIFGDYLNLLNSQEPEIGLLIKEYIRFVLNESIIGKIGEQVLNNRPSQASLWNVPIEDKNEYENVITNLKLINDKSDFSKEHLFFEREFKDLNFCSLRKGDPIILYHPYYIKNELSFQLLKGVIKQIEPDFIVVSLRNKFTSLNLFEILDGWIIEEDYLDSNTKYLFHSLFNFLLQSKEKISFLLGKKPPERKYKIDNLENLHTYKEIIQSALEYYPYYLIIGPPGTGKTRIVVKELLKFYFQQTENKILVCTYTNRAVDEIADILHKENLQNHYIRIGTKESTEIKENLLPNLSEELETDELEEKILNCRIFLGTAYSFLANPEIFELIKFDVAIVDEASQLLFPHLAGILTQVEKFILIGDEKQLPAVVLQTSQFSNANENLNKLGYSQLSMSYFEFLLNHNRIKNWNFSIGVLNNQGRMHPLVLEPINRIFYDGLIKTPLFRQSKEKNIILIEFIGKKLNSNANKRVLFVDLPLEKKRKLNISQAKIISSLINECFENFESIITNETFGIISPFRIQNAEIYSKLSFKARQKVTIDTVERFQGSERDIIFLSLPFNSNKDILLSSNLLKMDNGKVIDRKLNVSLTRSREFIVIFGNFSLLSSTMNYKDFLSYLLEESCIVTFKDFQCDINLNS
ncbi:MAG: DNA2/NAM7 family helicase [Ignavibacteria bacterium]|nr:DNA2/NAM7 family helicase [Ignavibacteria bacterium]